MAGVDFLAVRESVSMASVLALLNFSPNGVDGEQYRGPCPIHGSNSPGSRSFSVNLAKNAYRCFTCGSAGNQLDLWAKVRGLSLYDAAIDLCERSNVAVPWCGAPGSAVDTEKRNP